MKIQFLCRSKRRTLNVLTIWEGEKSLLETQGKGEEAFSTDSLGIHSEGKPERREDCAHHQRRAREGSFSESF